MTTVFTEDVLSPIDVCFVCQRYTFILKISSGCLALFAVPGIVFLSIAIHLFYNCLERSVLRCYLGSCAVPNMSRVLIVGAGLTGSLCACLLKRELQSKVHIEVWDKARGSGQRCIQTFIHKMNTLTTETPQTNSITLRTEPIRIHTQDQVLLNSARKLVWWCTFISVNT